MVCKKENTMIKYYDVVIPLGQFCSCSMLLRKHFLQNKSFPFDWSAGILECAGKGGLSRKIDLICNDFKDFFNQEDFVEYGTDLNDEQRWWDKNCRWMVNQKTGLQYQHDFPLTQSFENVFNNIKDKYKRRIDRFYSAVNFSDNVLFVYISRDEGFSEEYLIQQQEKLAKKFKDKTIDFLYIMNNLHYNPYQYTIKKLSENVHCVYMNTVFSMVEDKIQNFLGNESVIADILKNYCSSSSLEQMKNSFLECHIINQKIDSLNPFIDEKYSMLNTQLQKVINMLSQNETVVPKDREYDFLFSIGSACTCTDMMRRCNLQDKSYPFDWLWGSDFVSRCDYLINDFKDWFNKEDFELEFMTSNTKHAVWKNRRTQLVYNHDFIENSSNIEDSYLPVKEKYDRRISRLLTNLNNSSRIAIIYLERPNGQDKPASEIDTVNCWLKILNKFGANKQIDIYYIHYQTEQDVPICHRLNNHVFYYYYDYKWKQGEFDWEVDFGKLWVIFKNIKYIQPK